VRRFRVHLPATVTPDARRRRLSLSCEIREAAFFYACTRRGSSSER
jgi:hypothetical protein